MSGIISRESIFREQMRASTAREKPVLVPYDNDDVVVDWSSRRIETNVGDSRIQMTANPTGVLGDSDRARQQAEDMLGRLFVVPKGLPPEVPWRVHHDSISALNGTVDSMPGITFNDRATEKELCKRADCTSGLELVSRID